MTDLERAQQHLNLWLDADAKVASGQSYTNGDISVTRTNSAEIRKNINYWRAEVARLNRGGGARIRRIIPRDI
jgi:hypothetical protein